MTNQQLIITNYYSEHRDELVRFIAVRINDANEAEDIVQDIFLRLLRGRHLITPQTLPALIYTITRHAVCDYYRRRHVQRLEVRGERLEVRGESLENRTESIFSAKQIMEGMERTLARLPEPCCDIYRLHIYDSMKVSDIAQQLSLPYKQVENRLGQARKAVRQQLRYCM